MCVSVCDIYSATHSHTHSLTLSLSSLSSSLSPHPPTPTHTHQMGPQYMRQHTGIAQGSIVSSLLCSYFYGDLDHTLMDHLDTLEPPLKGADTLECDVLRRGLLLRLVDDYLYVTTSRARAVGFVRRMYDGFPEYGANVSALCIRLVMHTHTHTPVRLWCVCMVYLH